jgi:thiamine biosynthesis protein ThiS
MQHRIRTVAAIQVILNGEVRDLDAEVELERFLELFSLPKQRIAVELNGEVIRRADWTGVSVANGDKIEVVHFVGGG